MDMSNLSAAEYNRILENTRAQYWHKTVRFIRKDDKLRGKTGRVIGVDPRPFRGGKDANFLQIELVLQTATDHHALTQSVYREPEEVEIVEAKS